MTRKEMVGCLQWCALSMLLYGAAAVGLYVWLAQPAPSKLDSPTAFMLALLIGSTTPLNVVTLVYQDRPALLVVRSFVHWVVGCTAVGMCLHGSPDYALLSLGLMALNELFFRRKHQRLADGP
jgi:hypothetical protein